MKLSTLACGVGLLGALTHCGGSGTGGSTPATTSSQGDPGGPYAGNGSSGVYQQGQSPSDPFGRFVTPGPSGGQGSAGPYSDPGSAGPYAPASNCAAVCAKVASVQCVRTQNQNTPQGAGNGAGASASPTSQQTCEQECNAGLAELNSDCLRALYGEFISCVLNSSLTCDNGKIVAHDCPEPQGCGTMTTTTVDQPPNTGPATPAVRDAG